MANSLCRVPTGTTQPPDFTDARHKELTSWFILTMVKVQLFFRTNKKKAEFFAPLTVSESIC